MRIRILSVLLTAPLAAKLLLPHFGHLGSTAILSTSSQRTFWFVLSLTIQASIFSFGCQTCVSPIGLAVFKTAASSLWGTEKAEVRTGTPAIVGIRWLGANVAVSDQAVAVVAVIRVACVAVFAIYAFATSLTETPATAFGTLFLFLHFFPPVV